MLNSNLPSPYYKCSDHLKLNSIIGHGSERVLSTKTVWGFMVAVENFNALYDIWNDDDQLHRIEYHRFRTFNKGNFNARLIKRIKQNRWSWWWDGFFGGMRTDFEWTTVDTLVCIMKGITVLRKRAQNGEITRKKNTEEASLFVKMTNSSLSRNVSLGYRCCY